MLNKWKRMARFIQLLKKAQFRAICWKVKKLIFIGMIRNFIFFSILAVIAFAADTSSISEESFAAQVGEMHAQLDPGDKISIHAFLPNNPDKSTRMHL